MYLRVIHFASFHVDLTNQRCITGDELQRFARDEKFDGVFQTSVKDGTNVDEPMR